MRKRVKHPKLSPWLHKDIKEIIADRQTETETERLSTEIKIPEYKKLRNKVKTFVEKAKTE